MVCNATFPSASPNEERRWRNSRIQEHRDASGLLNRMPAFLQEIEKSQGVNTTTATK